MTNHRNDLVTVRATLITHAFPELGIEADRREGEIQMPRHVAERLGYSCEAVERAPERLDFAA